MSPEAQRVAIAESLGWNPTPEGQWTTNPSGRISIEYRWTTELPDFCVDLNACAEFERAMDAAQLCKYNLELDRVLTRADKDEHWSPRVAASYKWHATAAQRCEAYLRALGLWKEGV